MFGGQVDGRAARQGDAEFVRDAPHALDPARGGDRRLLLRLTGDVARHLDLVAHDDNGYVARANLGIRGQPAKHVPPERGVGRDRAFLGQFRGLRIR